MAFMLPGYTGEELRKMQDGGILMQRVKLFIFSWIPLRKDSSLGVRRARTRSAL